MIFRPPFLLFLWAAPVCVTAALAQAPQEVQPALDRISPASLRGHLSFIASDLLEGRGTPSPGLDLAAEYIAAQFRRAGLEPVGDAGYFQMATYTMRETNWDTFEAAIVGGGKTMPLTKNDVALQGAGPLNFDEAAIVKVTAENMETLKAADLEGKVALVVVPSDAAARGRMNIQGLMRLNPALMMLAGGVPGMGGRPQIVEPGQKGPAGPMRAMIRLRGAELTAWAQALPAGDTGAKLHLRLGNPTEHPVKLRNVLGLLRGSDAALKETVILLTAHYDHLGTTPDGDDHIYNGANDDGSGTVSVIEIASALASLPQHPKRSILFMTFFGEEIGGFGARYYSQHPIFAAAKTLADINLEQVGRSDSTEGPRKDNATFTGYTFSDIPARFEAAGKEVGISVYNDEKHGDAYFGRSDNATLARIGIPAHTICVAFDYSDYHGVGDQWEKIDYDNMAKVDRMIALGLWEMAMSDTVPQWNAQNSKTDKFREARKQ